MFIGIDATPLGEKYLTGVGNYSYNLIRTVTSTATDNTYGLYGVHLNARRLIDTNSKIRIIDIPDLIKFKSIWYSWTLWNYSIFPLQLIRDKIDVFVSTVPALPIYCPSPRMFIAYDLIPYIMPEAFTRRFRAIFKAEISHAARYANKIMAISNSTKNDLIKYLDVEPSKIEVSYPGYDNKCFVPVNDKRVSGMVMQKYGIDEGYYLYVGTLEPRKNLVRLIKAFIRLKIQHSVRLKLVVAGAKGWLYDDIFKLVQGSGMGKDIIFTGYVDYKDLPVLMSNAEALVYPSLYEGFGLPPLEAMACGTPVITSNVSSLPEVVGDAGIQVDPYNVDELANAMYSVIANSSLRQDLSRRGLERAKMFSWEKTAQDVLNVINELVKK